MRDKYLIDVDELHGLIDQQACIVVDCRADLEEQELGFRLYLEGHIPGARFASLDSDMADVPGSRGRHPLPEKHAFAETLENFGVSNESLVVTYDERNSMYASRFWWMVRWLGHERVRVLNGGFSAWTRAELPVETSVPSPKRASFEINAPLTRQVTVDEVKAFDGLLLDARAEDRFHGMNESIDHTAGHIPGATCSPFMKNLDSAGKFLHTFDRFEGLAENADVVCYCGSGVSATHNILALLLSGHEEPALYPGSWSEWIEDPNRPIET